LQPDRDFAEAFDAADARLRATLDSACSGEGGWAAQAVAAVFAVLEFAADDPDDARVLTAGAFDYGAYGAVRYRRMIDDLATRLAAGRRGPGVDRELPQLTEEALVGGIAEIVAERLRAGREAELPGLAVELAELVLAPYLGATEARRIANEKRIP
jgi:hypothetical protein